MSNANRLSLALASFTGLLEKLGANVTEQSGFVRVDGPEGRRMYVGRGKIVTTVHLSGFTSAHGTKLEKSPSRKVEQEMSWPDGLSAIGQLRLFADLYNEMMSLAPIAKKAASSKPEGTPVSPVLIDPALVLVAPTQPEARAEIAPEQAES